MAPSTCTKTYKLNDGNTIPAVGFGTWQAKAGQCEEAVKNALAAKYRHIDTAAIYGNEDEVGNAIRDLGVRREHIFLTTKLWNDRHQDAEAALDESLKKLKTDYVDLYLIHWPLAKDPKTGEELADWSYIDTYKSLQKLQKSGKTKLIGVSNFNLERLQKLLADPEVTVVPAVNQIEAHPLLQQPELREFLKLKNILVEAYSPLGSTDSPIINHPTVKEIADANGISTGQVLVSWAVQSDTVVLPKSVTESRIKSNIETITLSDEDFNKLNNLEKEVGTKRTCCLPGFSFDKA